MPSDATALTDFQLPLSLLPLSSSNSPTAGMATGNESSQSIDRTDERVRLKILYHIAHFLSLADCAEIVFDDSHGQFFEGRRGSPLPVTPSPEKEHPEGNIFCSNVFCSNVSEPTPQVSKKNVRIIFSSSKQHTRSEEIASSRQKNLGENVFTYPSSIRSYCLVVQREALSMRKSGRIRRRREERRDSPETLREPPRGKGSGCLVCRGSPEWYHLRRFYEHGRNLVLHNLMTNIPLSIFFHLSESLLDVTKRTCLASGTIGCSSLERILSEFLTFTKLSWDSVMERTWIPMKSICERLLFVVRVYRDNKEGTRKGEKKAEDNEIARKGGYGFGTVLRCGDAGVMRDTNVSEKLFHRLNRHDKTSKVISYVEREDDVASQRAKLRMQRMMHYPVSLRPFIATVIAPSPSRNSSPIVTHTPPMKDHPMFSDTLVHSNASLRSIVNRQSCPEKKLQTQQGEPSLTKSSSHSTPLTPLSDQGSPFMCTPKSFPPTPSSRSLLMARGTRFAEDVVFLARDQLRLLRNCHSSEIRTQMMASALRKGCRLAVFNAADTVDGVVLTRGQHCASKVMGGMLYCGTRSMIPVLRNCYVYFEMSILLPATPASNNATILNPYHMASLSIGLSTLQMPLNTLVGAWKSSIGLCTTGQLLANGHWCAPTDPRHSPYGVHSTVGCLVRLNEEETYYEAGDTTKEAGIPMAEANVCFNVDGILVTPPLLSNTAPKEDDSMQSPSITEHHHLQAMPPFTILIPRHEEFFPTLTLHSPHTQVMCRFCAEDMLATSREGIGAPLDQGTVYALDGSVLFHGETYHQEDHEEVGDLCGSECSDQDDCSNFSVEEDDDMELPFCENFRMGDESGYGS